MTRLYWIDPKIYGERAKLRPRRARRSTQPLGLMRTVIATFVVPAVVVLGMLLSAIFTSAKLFADVASAAFVVMVQYLFVLAFTVAVVVPLRFAWLRWDFMRGWVTVVIGAGLGCVLACAFSYAYSRTPIFSPQPIPVAGYARLTLVLCLIGAAAGLVFWLIAKSEMRPNTSLERTRGG
jgi:hypothetical protein